MKKPFSKWSILFSVIGAILFYMVYEIAPIHPEGSIVLILRILFFTSIIAAAVSLICSVLGMIENEKGLLKFVGPMIMGVVFLDFFL